MTGLSFSSPFLDHLLPAQSCLGLGLLGTLYTFYVLALLLRSYPLAEKQEMTAGAVWVLLCPVMLQAQPAAGSEHGHSHTAPILWIQHLLPFLLDEQHHQDFRAWTAPLGGTSLSALKFAAELRLFLLFVCFNMSLLIMLKKKSVFVLLKITNP